MDDYTVQKNEIALLLRPCEPYESSHDLETAVIIPKDHDLPEHVMGNLIDIVTLMSSFLVVAMEDDYVYETVNDKRMEFLKEEYGDRLKGYEVVEGTDNKVIKLTPHTKTKGNA